VVSSSVRFGVDWKAAVVAFEAAALQLWGAEFMVPLARSFSRY